MMPAELGGGVAVSDGNMLMHIIERAANAPQFDLERLEKLLDLKDRWDRAEAVKAYAAAKVAFKSDPPRIVKDKHVKFTNRAGTVTEYDHATHAEVTGKISEALARHGFTHSWSMAQEQNKITVRCTLLHIAGHSESVELFSLSDDSGGKNSIQAVASANTYLQRYTLLAVCGLSTGDMPDDDGAGAGKKDERPEIHADVWTALGDAAAEGTEPLKRAWRGLSEATRTDIANHYGDDWMALKTTAAANTHGV